MKNLLLPIAAFTICATFIAGPLRAQSLWQQTSGPGSGQIGSITVSSNGHLFVCSSGLLRSKDNGGHWDDVTPPTALGIIKVAISPSGTLFASTGPGNGSVDSNIGRAGLFRSTDEGATWSKTIDLLNLTNNASRLTITTDGEVFFITTTGNNALSLLRSSNDGIGWDTLPVTTNISDVTEFESSKSGVLFLSTGSNDVYRSTNRGTSWSKIVNGIPQSEGFATLADEPNHGILLGNNGGVYRSQDSGRTWSFAFDKVDGLVENANGHILAQSGRYLKLSTDGGDTWEAISNPYIDSYPFILDQICPPEFSSQLAVTADNRFLMGFGEELYITKSSAETGWDKINIPDGFCNAVIAHPNGTIIAAAQSLNSLWRSTDNGVSWSSSVLIDSPLFDLNVIVFGCFAIDSNHDIIAGGHNGTVYISKDAGVSWESSTSYLTTGNFVSIAVAPNGFIYACSSTDGIFRSTDRGVTWDQLNEGISNPHMSSVDVNAHGDVFASGYNGIYRSVDNALTWQTLAINSPMNGVFVTPVTVAANGDIIAAVQIGAAQNVGVFRSTDNGNTWNKLVSPFMNQTIYSFLSTQDGKVFAATAYGVFMLDTHSDTWTSAGSGLPNLKVHSITRNANGQLFAGTYGSGVFSSTQNFNTSSASVKQTATKADRFELLSNYPNPFNPSTTISFSIPERSVVKLEVLDALGRIVTTLENGVINPGWYTTTFNALGCTSGVYYAHLTSGTHTQVMPMVLSK